jgi:hypothetical protein
MEYPHYLQDSPDYYIEWWTEIWYNKDIFQEKVENLLQLTWKFELPQFWSWTYLFKLWGKVIWYIWLNEYEELGLADINEIKLHDGRFQDEIFNNKGLNFQWKWYAKILYLMAAIEVMKKWMILSSSSFYLISNEAKYVWNSLVDSWFAKIHGDQFRIIPERLESLQKI